MVQMHVGRELRMDHDPQAEQARHDDAKRGVGLDPAVGIQPSRRQGADHPGDEGPDQQRDPRQIGQDDPGQHRMADTVAHQGPASQHQKAAEQGRGNGDNDGDQRGLDHEGKGEGGGQPGHGRACRMRRRLARMPCVGARTKAARKISVCRTTMMPPVAPSRKKLR